MKFRVVLLTEIVAPYRIPVFNALAQHDEIDLHVIFLAETDPVLRKWPVYKDEIRFSYQVLPSWRRRIRGHNFVVNRGVASALHEHAPDALVCGGYNYVAAWQALNWARRNDIPFFLWAESTAKDLRSGSRFLETLKAEFMRECAGFVVPGSSSFEYLRNYGLAADRIFTAPNAVDIDWFTARAGEARRRASLLREELNLPDRYFLFAGRLMPEKGVFDLLVAYKSLTPELRSTVGLILVGDGESEADLRRSAREITPGTIVLPGFTQREELASYYALADALVFPSRSDPWGLVVNEAMACGAPIIASSAAGCVSDLVEDGWNGFVVEPGDVHALSRAMNALANDHEVRQVMRQRSNERIQNYSPEACASGIANAILSSAVLAHD